MYRFQPGEYVAAISIVLLLGYSSVSARTIEPNASIGLQYTDNARLSADNEQSELIASASVGAAIDMSGGPYRLNANTSLSQQRYTRDTFGDQQYFSLGMTAGWQMFKDRLDWTLQDFFSQKAVDSLSPATPDNIQDTNVVTFGPSITIPISGRQSISVRPEYQKFTYEQSNLDNQQKSVTASWNYQLLRTMGFSIGGNVSNVDYDDEAINDNKFSSVTLSLSGQRSRSEYSVSVGTTNVDTENISEVRGSTSGASWLFNLSGYSKFRASYSSNITNTSSRQLFTAIDPESGDIFSLQPSDAVLRNKLLRITYSRQKASWNASAYAELSEQDYNLLPIDQETRTAGLSFSYPVTAALTMGFSSRYNQVEQIDISRLDDLYSFGINTEYTITRGVRASFNISFQDKDSNFDSQDFSETSLFFNLTYSPR